MFAQIALPVHLNTLFEYEISSDTLIEPKVGQRVEVPFRNKHLIGIIIELSDKAKLASHKIKSIRKIFDAEPLVHSEIIRLCEFASQYYHYPIGEVLMTTLPKRLKEGHPAQLEEELCYKLNPAIHTSISDIFKRAPKKKQLYAVLTESANSYFMHTELIKFGFNSEYIRQFLAQDVIIETKVESLPKKVENPLKLNTEQADCFTEICSALTEFKIFLLEGVTGSGKTEVYLQTIAKVIEDPDAQALVMVPEISLTPQTIARFEKRFDHKISVLHSSLTDKKKCNHWLNVQQGNSKIIIGTRSALFTPFKNLKVIIIDEEHDQSFKQQEQFRYSSRDLAIAYAKQLNIPVILGSATPALESLLNAKQNKFHHLKLPSRVNNQSLPEIKVIDCRRQKLNHGLSQQLINEIKACLERSEQAMLFINRRGYSPVLMCQSCGWHAECNRCETKMTYHRDPYQLQCHFCLKTIPLPNQCPECENPQLSTIGLGTQRLEEGLHEHFSNYPILRLDRDNAPTHKQLTELFNQIKTEKPLVMIGTQLIAKGHHFPNVTLVGIIDTDNALYSGEFRAVEHMAQVVTQVSGRAGRESKPGQVILQTYHPDNPYLKHLLGHDYHALAETLLQERDNAQLPPFAYMAVLRAEAHTQGQVFNFLHAIKNKLPEVKSVEILGPIPLNRPKRAGYFRGEIIFRGYARSQLQKLLHQIKVDSKLQRQVRWHLEVDPIHILN